MTRLAEDRLKTLVADRQADGGAVFVLLDAARHADVFTALEEHSGERCCLYKDASKKLERSAPHLARLEQDSPLLETFLKRGWGESWGVLAVSEASIEVLRNHFRRFLMAQTEDGKQVYFRYYDPRVFRLYLPTCTPEEADYVFGPVSSYLMEEDGGGALLSFQRGEQREVELVRAE